MRIRPTLQKVAAENQDLRVRLEKAEESLRQILSGEADALFVSGVSGGQLFALKGADQSYRTLIENMSEGALTLTPAGLILYANRRFSEMLKTPLEKVIGSEIHDWFAHESRQVLQTLLRKDAVDNRREELVIAATDGTQVPVNLSVSHLVLDGMPDSFCMVATDLTEQKRSEAILAAESLARAILEQAADAIVICDESGRILRASKQAQALCGNNPVGQLFEHAFPLCQLDGTAFSAVGAIDTNRRQMAEARLEHDGQGVDLLVSVGHLKDAQSKLRGSVITLTDITERKTHEFALKKIERQLFEALTIAKIGYWEYEYSTAQFILNDQYYLLHKITAEEAGGYRMSAADFARRYVYPEDAPKVGRSVRLAFDSPDPDYFAKTETRILTGDGEIVWVEVRFRIQKDLHGNTIRLIGVNQDITERKLAEKTLRASEQRLELALDAGQLGVWDLDLVHDTSWRSLQHDRIFGYESLLPEWGQAIFLRHVVSEDRDRVSQCFEEATRTVQLDFECQITRTDQDRRWIHARGKVYRDPMDRPVRILGTVIDITERKQAEARIIYLNRVYAVLSGINALIVRVNDREELFREACRVAVAAGGFRMAMISIADRSTMKIVPVASAGKDEELLTAIKGLLSSSDDAPKTMVARAIREKQTIVSNDTLSDPVVLLGKQYAESGVRSMAILPLIVADEAVGTITLYARESEFFHEEELKLLTELAGDIAYAIDHINKQERLNYLAYYDVLTGLANRTLFLERAAQYMRSADSGGHKLAIGLIDLERFKNINDSLGRPAGDALLKQVAEWLTQFARDASLLARIDADHFAFVVPEVKSDGNLANLVDNIVKTFQAHLFRVNNTELRLAAKTGIALFPDDGTDAETVYRNAEAALKAAKKRGDRYLFHAKTMTEAVAAKLTLENQLRQAIDNEEFVLHYQPKVNLMSGKVTSAEALIRWNDPRTGLVPPGKFIPVLEETGLISEVGRWALRQAITDYLRWRDAGLPAVRIAVNVSPLQLRNIDFIDEIRQVIALDPHAVEGLELEITESVIMNNIEFNIATLQAIRDLGVTIAIDDFGTGFSSLSYLARLPVDTLKIDRAFVIDMTAGPEGLALVSTIINLAHALKRKVVAEGVETEQQSRLLRLLGCDEMQGFLFSKPVPIEIFETRFLAPHPVG